MHKPGSNLPNFRAVQLDFAAHIRNPEENPMPTDVEPRRMKIYADLFFNNVKSFLDSAFPISREIVGEAKWRELAREFLHLHNSESPYFLQISEEFLTFLHTTLDNGGLQGLPPFLLELCHYEWVELALDVAVEEADPESYLAEGDLSGEVLVSPLVRPLVYAYPVHEIGVQNQPESAPDNPVYLIVYRNSDLQVRFVESNPVTHRLLDLLGTQTADTAFETLRGELAEAGREVSAEQMSRQGLEIIKHLHDLGVILGARA